MTPYQRIVAFAIAVALLLVVLELVRRRTLRIEYSWLWIVSVAGLLALIASPALLFWVSDAVGAQAPVNAVFAIAFVFLVAICIHFSVKISQLTSQVKKLAQQLAIVEAEKQQLEQVAQTPSEEERRAQEGREAADRA